MPARGNAAGHRAAPSRDDGADGAHGPEDGARKKNLASPVAREIRGSSDAERSYEKRGRRGGGSPRGAPAPEPAKTGRAPSTGQRRPALPRASPAVPSALGGLASGFGMGPGVPRPPWPLTGGRRSSCDGCVPPTREGDLPRALGAAQRARRTGYPDRPELSCTRQAHGNSARGDATGKSSGD